MKLNTLLRSALVGATLAASSLFANTVVLTSTGFNGGLSGGEFKAVTSDDGTFLTFCLESQISISLGNTYNYTIDDTVLNQNDKISQGTAYLYSEFAAGSLAGYFANRNVNAGLLQKAFWMLEDEMIYDNTNPYITLVEGIFGVAVKSDYTGSHIKVMNVWTRNNEDIQSQLVLVPDSGMTALLLGLGLLSLAAFRRKL